MTYFKKLAFILITIFIPIISFADENNYFSKICNNFESSDSYCSGYLQGAFDILVLNEEINPTYEVIDQQLLSIVKSYLNKRNLGDRNEFQKFVSEALINAFPNNSNLRNIKKERTGIFNTVFINRCNTEDCDD